jgi:hypothetical protein
MPTHDEICKQAVAAVAQVDREAILAAFVGSLSTRNLPARSAFGSYVVLQHFVVHEFEKSDKFSMGWCAYCGIGESLEHVEYDESIQKYPFQAQHTNIRYSAHDLSTFGRRKVDTPTDDDIGCLNKMLDALRSLPASAQLGDLNKSLQGIIKSNKHERMILLETFGYAGILCPSDQQHYSAEFVQHDFANSRQPQQYYKREWDYPVRFWTGSDGVNEDMVDRYFAQFL